MADKKNNKTERISAYVTPATKRSLARAVRAEHWIRDMSTLVQVALAEWLERYELAAAKRKGRK